MTTDAAATKTKDLVITRVFDAPVELVWQAWTDPRHVMRWWGPEHFTSPSAQIDFREGGTALVAMRAPAEYGGGDNYSLWTYHKIVPMRRIEFVQTLVDKDGARLDPTTLGLPADFPQDQRTVLVFKPLGDKTEFTITQYGLPISRMGEMAELGMNQSLDKLAATL